MDILNDYHPIYPQNPDNIGLSESEISENEEHIERLTGINNRKKRKKIYTFDDWSMIYSEQLWHIWCVINEFKSGTNILDRMDYPGFCSMCYDNSTKL